MELTPSQKKTVRHQFDSFCRKVLREEARDYERKIISDGDAKYIADLTAAGIKINKVDKAAFVDVVKNSVWKEYEKEFGALRQRVIDTK